MFVTETRLFMYCINGDKSICEETLNVRGLHVRLWHPLGGCVNCVKTTQHRNDSLVSKQDLDLDVFKSK